MTLPIERNATISRKAALAKARQSRRPSRLGEAAGVAAKPDYLVADDAGFPGLLGLTWARAAAAPSLAEAVDILLTLAGHVPADIQLRALPMEQECAMSALFGKSWRPGGPHVPGPHVPGPRAAAPGNAGFLGEIGLNTSGRVVLRVPSQRPLSADEDLVGGVLRVPWPVEALSCYQEELDRATTRHRDAVAGCRAWLAAAGQDTRHDMLEHLKEGARRTAPFVLYQGDRQYTNFRDRNTLTGKTLWPGHPDCALSSLQSVPLWLWSDHDVLLVVCLTLLVRSAGFARIEEANGTQLTLDHVGHLLERTRVGYNRVTRDAQVPPATQASVVALNDLALALGKQRGAVTNAVQLYREIHGPLMHKVERVAGAPGAAARRLEAAVCDRLRDVLPLGTGPGGTGNAGGLAALGTSIEAAPEWLAKPHGEFGTGLESLTYETVRAATEVFAADFAMSRGIRTLTALVNALRAQEWPQIAGWDLPYFFCCVVPSAKAGRHFGGSVAQLADMAWAMSARMQYNSWHFLVGNLPKVPEVAARDYFVPPTIPDIAYYSDQHHHGHVAAKVRFSIRSPQSVELLGRRFNGIADLRLLRCDGTPFNEQDLLAAHRTSAFVAKATTLAGQLAAAGADIEIKEFDSAWHWAKITSLR